jgi:hypothetical protein
LYRGSNLNNKELKEVTDEIEKNLSKMNLDHYDEEEGILSEVIFI